jgi:hypothetical protein
MGTIVGESTQLPLMYIFIGRYLNKLQN